MRPIYFFLAALLCAVLAAAGYKLEESQSEPGRIARIIQTDLVSRQRDVAAISEHKAEVIAWLQKQGPPDATAWLIAQRFQLFAWKEDSLIAWTTTATAPQLPPPDTGRLLISRNGVAYYHPYQAAWLPSGISLSVVLPIITSYPFSNQYLSAHFAATRRINPRTVVTDSAGANAAVLHAPDGRAIGFVHGNHGESTPRLPTIPVILLWALVWLLTAAGVGIAAGRLALDKATYWLEPALIAAFLIIARSAMYAWGYPFTLHETALFSPRLYASSALLPSLGDLLLNILCTVWLLAVLLRALRRSGNEHCRMARPVAWVLAILCGCVLGAASVLFLKLLRSLIVDSLIPFDSLHLSTLDGVALTGLGICGGLMATLLLLTAILRRLLSGMLPGIAGWLIAALGLILMLPVIGSGERILTGCLMAWLLLVIVLQQRKRLREYAGGFRPASFLWAIAHALLLTILLLHYTSIREDAMRQSFAGHIATRHDDAVEYAFGEMAPRLENDTALLRYLRRPQPLAAQKALLERLSTVYFSDGFPAYQAHVYVYNAAGQAVLAEDTTSLRSFSDIASGALPSRAAYNLYYREASTNDHTYLGILPIHDSGQAGEEIAGTLVIDLEQKKIVAETVLPELLQPATVNQEEKAAGYSYAVYADRKLVAQTSDYPFAFYIAPDTSGKEFQERKGKDYTMLIYTPDAHRTVIVWHRRGIITDALTVFSYLLAMRLLLFGLLSLEALSGAAFRSRRNGASWLAGIGLRRRVQLSVTGIVLLSFLLIGVLTVTFLQHQYSNNSKAARQAMMQVVARAIQQWIREHGAAHDAGAWRSLMGTQEFRTFLSGIAASQKVDINLFGADGKLTVATQPAIYDNGLLAPLMRPGVLHQMYTAPRPLLMQEEEIGSLRYISCYAPLRDEDAHVAAFLNVPLFFSQRALDEQVSGIVVALINLYVATFLLSSLLALAISRWVTRAFDIIIRQFSRLSLRGNEPLRWPYEDEIGLLVHEYNKMVEKVEESAALLARSEREEAWREMARQVAHEIKNPLTPMKLNIQYLQRAIASGRSDTVQMASRVSESLLEQIENLSTIAGEFSDFARIGSGEAMETDLADVMRNVAELYVRGDVGAEVTYQIPTEAMPVMADRSQLVRILTNLMQNAVQAIPEGRPGLIMLNLREENGIALAEVSDNGSGIPEAAQKKLFTPYFTTKSSGTGLGLAMSRQMVEAWGGTISYVTAEGKGTTFTLCLPLKK